MTCSACGRRLKNPQSKESGYGPVCYRKIFGTGSRNARNDSASHMTDIPYYDIPGQMTLDDYLQTKD